MENPLTEKMGSRLSFTGAMSFSLVVPLILCPRQFFWFHNFFWSYALDRNTHTVRDAIAAFPEQMLLPLSSNYKVFASLLFEEPKWHVCQLDLRRRSLGLKSAFRDRNASQAAVAGNPSTIDHLSVAGCVARAAATSVVHGA
mmetsp:Transcript_47213/g.79055  ORF Transcript_47213/g.79055 Transcript_47213/m.79055 type:complete len:142 (+) Transcript_47213:42-467(+)